MGNEQVLLWCGVIAGPIFILVFLIEGSLRPGYRPLREPMSSLSRGKRGWVQQTNFFFSGILLLACAFGLSTALQQYGGSFWGPLLIGIYALGLLGTGVFVTDSHAGEDAPQSTLRTTGGKLHDLFSSLLYVSFLVACFVFAHLFAVAGETGWMVYSIVTGVLYGCGFLLFAWLFSRQRSGPAPIAGSLQLVTFVIGAVWFALLCLHFL